MFREEATSALAAWLMQVLHPDWTGIWRCWLFRRKDNPGTWRKTTVPGRISNSGRPHWWGGVSTLSTAPTLLPSLRCITAILLSLHTILKYIGKQAATDQKTVACSQLTCMRNWGPDTGWRCQQWHDLDSSQRKFLLINDKCIQKIDWPQNTSTLLPSSLHPKQKSLLTNNYM